MSPMLKQNTSTAGDEMEREMGDNLFEEEATARGKAPGRRGLVLEPDRPWEDSKIKVLALS